MFLPNTLIMELKNFRASPAYSELEERLELLESSRSSFSFLSTSVQCHIVVTVFTLLTYIRIKQIPLPPLSPLSITFCIIVIMTNLVDSLFTSAIVVFLAKIATTIMNNITSDNQIGMIAGLRCHLI